MLCSPGILVTAVQNKEVIAEREIIDALEAAADELYPGTGGDEGEDEEEGDIEDMLKRELEGLAAHKTRQSLRFRVCKRDTVCSEFVPLSRADRCALHQRSAPSRPRCAGAVHRRAVRADCPLLVPVHPAPDACLGDVARRHGWAAQDRR